MLIIGIETSCDETSVALLECSGGLEKPRFKVLKNIVSSQISLHREFGGVVPNLAKREHEKNLPIIIEEILKITPVDKIDAVTVTVGPGLEPTLWTGIEFAEEFAVKNNLPIIPANHLRGHLLSFLLDNPESIDSLFPSIGLIASGGHTILLLMEGLSKYKKLGETRDDAAGETFDKAARLLGLPYPGGPEVEKLAASGRSDFIAFPRPMLHQKNYDFSFSGLKTALLYYLKDSHKADWREENKLAIKGDHVSLPKNAEDLAASFQAAVIDSLVGKAMKAADAFGAKSVILSGGVAANKSLRNSLLSETEKRKIKFLAPSSEYNTDNAAMIVVAGYLDHLSLKKRPLKANGNLNLN